MKKIFVVCAAFAALNFISCDRFCCKGDAQANDSDSVAVNDSDSVLVNDSDSTVLCPDSLLGPEI